MSNRTWHKGPPPHIGWWNASNAKVASKWRWWDGKNWSYAVDEWDSAETACHMAEYKYDGDPSFVRWTTYYPKNARVPRIKP